jgi:hypothetical protein
MMAHTIAELKKDLKVLLSKLEIEEKIKVVPKEDEDSPFEWTEREIRLDAAVSKDDKAEARRIIEEDEPTGRMVILTMTLKDTEMLELVLQRGGDPNFIEPDKYKFEHVTPLLEAEFGYEDREMFDMLLKYGADINMDTPEGTVLFVCLSFVEKSRRDIEDVKFLLDRGAELTQEMIDYVLDEQLPHKLIKFLLKYKK